MVTTVESVNPDASFTGPRPTPTIPDGGSFSVYSKVTINAPAEAVFNALITVSGWKDWNKFVPDVTINQPAAAQQDLHVWAEGEVLTFNCRMDKASDSVTTNKELAVQVGPLVTRTSLGDGDAGRSVPARTTVRWISQGFPNFIVKAEHVNWIDDNGDGTTAYEHWETFGGYAVPVIKMMHGKALHEHFIDWAVNLKAYVEQKQAGS